MWTESQILEPDDVCDTTTALTATTAYQNILSHDYPQNYRGYFKLIH